MTVLLRALPSDDVRCTYGSLLPPLSIASSRSPRTTTIVAVPCGSCAASSPPPKSLPTPFLTKPSPLSRMFSSFFSSGSSTFAIIFSFSLSVGCTLYRAHSILPLRKPGRPEADRLDASESASDLAWAASTSSSSLKALARSL